MKIHILSDLHIEFGKFDFQPIDADVVVFAGDIGVGIDGIEWINSLKIDHPVIYVLGNHEFYHNDLSILDVIKIKAADNIHVLENDEVYIDNVRFLGCTLWTDFLFFGESEKYFSVQAAKRGMSDFEVIRNNGKRFIPEDSIKFHGESRAWLQENLESSFDGNTIVVTHHLPSSKSVHPRFANSKLTAAFASRLENLILDGEPDLWIHGHTHDKYDYFIGNTRVICNPRGYYGYERTENYDSGFIVNV